MNATCTIDRCEGCPTKVVCRCLQVTEEQLVRMVTALDLRTVRELRKTTGVGDGCTCCHQQLRETIERIHLPVTA